MGTCSGYRREQCRAGWIAAICFEKPQRRRVVNLDGLMRQPKAQRRRCEWRYTIAAHGQRGYDGRVAAPDGALHRVSSFRPCRQVTTITAGEVSNSARASRMAESTADFRFLRADTPVAAPLRRTFHSCPASFHCTRYSTSAILREPDLRTPAMRSCVVLFIATSTSCRWRGLS